MGREMQAQSGRGEVLMAKNSMVSGPGMREQENPREAAWSKMIPGLGCTGKTPASSGRNPTQSFKFGLKLSRIFA